MKLFPPFTGLGRRLESAMRKALWTYAMVPEDGKLAVALSGGKDSLTLLVLLHAVSGRGFPPLELTAIHVQGEFTCGAGVDLALLKNICEQLSVPLIVKESHMKREELECYSCSRARRSLLFTATKEAGATTLAFGHHRDDHAQTLMMNLLHKGEFAGNLPQLEMVDYGVTVIRPLIYIAEDQIRTFAKEAGFARITCQCPVGQRSVRKKVDALIDELELHFPHARANLARAGLVYGSDKARRK